MKSDGNSFCGDVVLDRFINAYRDKDNILNQKYDMYDNQICSEL